MQATIDEQRRSILAEEPVVDGCDGGFGRGSAADRGARPVPAMVVAVLAMVALAATFVWATLGDSGAQLMATDTASAAAPNPPGEPGSASAHSSVHRDALVVDVGRLDVDPGTSTESTTGAAPTTAVGGSHGATDDTDTAPAIGPEINSSTMAMRSPEGALQGAETSAPTAGRVGGSTTAPAPTTNASGGTGPTSTTPSASISPSTPTSTSGGSVSGIAWEENFDSLDAGRWQVEHSTYGDGNGERQCYQPDNVRVANGRLVLTARAETATCPNGSTRTVTSGMVRSRGLTFSPGQAIEFRVKLTPPDPSNQAGLWPAVWASSWAGSWPGGGELDFLEVMTAEDPRRAVFSMHYADRSGRHELQNRGVPLAGHFSDGWHTIRFDYGRNGNLVWYLDGSKVFSVSAADTIQGYPAPFDQTIHEIKVNLAVGGSPGPLGSGALGSTGATFEIDYIKVSDL